MGHVTILQGPSGNGKSWVTEQMQPDAVCSADNYFKKHGIAFDGAKLQAAHNECFQFFMAKLLDGIRMRAKNWHVIVDNTNLELHEISPYILAADSAEYTSEIVRVVCDPETAWKRQIHNVPFRLFCHQVYKFDTFRALPRWKWREISNNVKTEDVKR